MLPDPDMDPQFTRPSKTQGTLFVMEEVGIVLVVYIFFFLWEVLRS